MNSLVLLFVIATASITATTASELATSGFKCIPSSTFKYDCNTCYCSVNGTQFACTRMACPVNKGIITYLYVPPTSKPEITTPNFKCIPSSIFTYDCNTCYCSPNGTNYKCTRMVCVVNQGIIAYVHIPPTSKPEITTSNSKCIPSSIFTYDCNTCYCNADGTNYACTMLACLVNQGIITYVHIPSTPNTGLTTSDLKCIPLSTFTYDCNTCYCSADGRQYSCTQLTCLVNQGIIRYVHIPSTPQPGLTTSDLKCIPLATFTNDCNTCYCSADGRQYACTQMACLVNQGIITYEPVYGVGVIPSTIIAD